MRDARTGDVNDLPEWPRAGRCLACGSFMEKLRAGRKRGAAVYCATCAREDRPAHTVRA
jgi:hypothetical protein